MPGGASDRWPSAAAFSHPKHICLGLFEEQRHGCLGTWGTRDSDVPQPRMSSLGFIEGGRQMVSTNTLMGDQYRQQEPSISNGEWVVSQGSSGGSDGQWGPRLPRHPKASWGAGRDPELQNELLQGLCLGEGPHTRTDTDTAPQVCAAPNPPNRAPGTT